MAKVEVVAVLEKVNTGAELTKEETQAVLEGDISEPGAATAEVEGPKKEEPKEKVTTGADKPEKKESEDGEKEGAAAKEEASKKDVKPPEDKKKEGEDAAKVEPKAEDWGEKSEKELKKPEGEEDLTSFSPREKGLFYELRQTRRRAQRAEVEAREAEYKLFQNKQTEKAKQKPNEEMAKIFEGKEDDDLLTVGEAKKVMEAANRQPASMDEPMKKQIVGMQFQLNLMKIEKKYPDAPQVIGLLDELLDNEEPYSKMAQEEVSAAFQRGGNFVQVAYNFIKGHPKFPEYEARLKGSSGSNADSSAAKDPDLEEKKERAKKLEENQNKSKTTGGAGGGETRRADEYSEQELAEMTPAQWKKLPEKTRRKLLEG